MSGSQATVRPSGIYVATLILMGVGAAMMPAATAEEERRLEVSERSGWPKVDPDGTALKDGRLDPEIVQVEIEYAFQVTIPAATTCTVSVSMTFTGPPKSDHYFASLSPSRITQSFSQASGGPLVSANGTTSTEGWVTVLRVQATRDAPAFKAIELPVTATATVEASSAADCSIGDSLEAKSSASIIPDYVARARYEPKTYSLNGGQNKQVTFAILAINDGNGPTKVTTRIHERTPGLEGVMGPVDTLLESRAFSGETARDSQELMVTARTPHNTGYTNKMYVIDVALTATSDAFVTGEVARDERTVTLMVKVQGVYVPALDGLWALMAMASSLLLVALRQRGGEQ